MASPTVVSKYTQLAKVLKFATQMEIARIPMIAQKSAMVVKVKCRSDSVSASATRSPRSKISATQTVRKRLSERPSRTTTGSFSRTQ